VVGAGAALLALTAAAARPAASPTVYDGTLHVYWLADADLAKSMTFGVQGINADGSMDYSTAVAWVAAMNRYDGTGYLGHDTWTLPTTPSSDSTCSSRNHAFGYGCTGSAMGRLYSTTLRLRAPDTAVAIPDETVKGFTGLQPYLYWTGTAAANKKQGFVSFSFDNGWTGANVSKHDMYVLPMVPGNPFLTPAGSDVTWLADAGLPRTARFAVSGIAADGSMTHRQAHAWVAELDRSRKYGLGRTDWELPPSGGCGAGFGCTSGPLGELYSELVASPRAPVVTPPQTSLDGFDDLQPYLYWSCLAATATTACSSDRPEAGQEWSFSFGNGYEGTDLLANDLYVLPYYVSHVTRPTCKPPAPGKSPTCA
jgi:hypothetical protein